MKKKIMGFMEQDQRILSNPASYSILHMFDLKLVRRILMLEYGNSLIQSYMPTNRIGIPFYKPILIRKLVIVDLYPICGLIAVRLHYLRIIY